VNRRIPLLLSGATIALLTLGAVLFVHARGATNSVALSSAPKEVTVIEASSAQWRATRRYVGTVQPWVEARIGPQLVSAYAETVLVRPGAAVRRGQVLATLDCRNASALAAAVRAQARAVERTQTAIARETDRMSGLLKDGFVSADELEQKQAESESKQAQALALRSQALGTSLQVQDCVLRAPFDGEVIDRTADPGTFVRPGSPVVRVVDRRVVRITADVPEDDFEAVAPGAPVAIRLLATGASLSAQVSRRAPGAEAATRTVHFEIDLPNPKRDLPVGTTADLRVEAGAAVPATEVPLLAASVRGTRANLFVVEDGVAHARQLKVLGEREGSLFVDPSLSAGAQVVTEGRTTLSDGEPVKARREGARLTEAQP
jgi:RND family efflux transporter MFP subunit